MQALQWIWDNREMIGSQAMEVLLALTALVHILQRASATFGRLAARTSTKHDDSAAQRLSRWLAWCDSTLLSISKWLPHVGVNARKQWSRTERLSRTSGAPDAES